jgi:hypothetical protein
MQYASKFARRTIHGRNKSSSKTDTRRHGLVQGTPTQKDGAATPDYHRLAAASSAQTQLSRRSGLPGPAPGSTHNVRVEADFGPG